MPSLPEMRKKAIEAIGEVLTEDEIVHVVRAATGKDIFNVYAGRNDPRAIQLSKTLDQLELEGTERWLLTYILIAIVREKICKLIVKTWPKTLVSLPQAEAQVESALTYLNTLLKVPLPNNVKQELKSKLKQDAFKEIRHRIDVLYTYKNLHEDLHQLSMKLTFGELVQSVSASGADFKAIAEQCAKTLRDKPALEATLGKDSDFYRSAQRTLVKTDESAMEKMVSANMHGSLAACVPIAFCEGNRGIRGEIASASQTPVSHFATVRAGSIAG